MEGVLSKIRWTIRLVKKYVIIIYFIMINISSNVFKHELNIGYVCIKVLNKRIIKR